MNDVPLRDYVEAIFEEHRRQRTTDEQEREKSARALRDEMERSIEQGDGALRDHIEAQVHQLEALLDAVRREMLIRHEAAKEAVAKSEGSYDKRFESVNELRGQMQDLIASHQKALSDLTNTLMPREVADAQVAEMRAAIGELTRRLDKLE